MEKCTGRSRISAQDMARDGMAEKWKGQYKNILFTLGSPEAKFLVRVFEVAQES